MPSSIEAFATLANDYCIWLAHDKAQGAPAALEALHRLLQLYTAALDLPDARGRSSPPTLAIAPPVNRETIATACARFPLQYYGELFDPLPVPPDAPGVGDLTDDLLDIYHDLQKGLIPYSNGDIPEAVWQWRFGLRSHWGEHATAAIRALHCWLASYGEIGL